jgi:hypothetical protein
MRYVHVKLSDGSDLPEGWPIECRESESAELIGGFDAVTDAVGLEKMKADLRPAYETWQASRLVAVIAHDVNAERDQRTAAGFAFEGKTYDSRPEDQKRIAGAAQLAFMAVVAGAQPGNLLWHGGEQPFAWIAGDNSITTMDAHTVIEFGRAAARWESAHVFAARAIKDAENPPADWRDDKWWPARA